MKVCENADCNNEATFGIVFEDDKERTLIVCEKCKREIEQLHKDVTDETIIAVFELH